MISSYVSSEEVTNARTLLDKVVERCQIDRWDSFPKDVRDRISRGGPLPGIVLMGLDGYILDEHVRLVDCVLANNPGLELRAVVSDSAESVYDPELIRKRGWRFLTTKAFFEQAAQFADCVVVDG